MTPRSRGAAKAAGTRMESAAAAFLARALGDDRIERRAKSGAKDRGDIGGLRARGRRVVAEVKSTARMELPGWLREAAVERANDDAAIGVVIHKRHGVSEQTEPGRQYVTMTLADFAWLLGADIDPSKEGES